MPDQELVETLEREDRHRARLVLAGAFTAIMLCLLVIAYLSYSANQRADRASRSACTLVGVVTVQNRLLADGIGALIAPSDARQHAVDALASEVRTNQEAARKAAQAANC